MGESAESWRVSEVLLNPLRKQRVAIWEQENALHLTPRQRQALTEIAICVRDFERERALDGDPPLEEISQDPRRWAEFVDDHRAVKDWYNRLMAKAVRHELFAHPLVLEWVGMRRAVGDRKALHRLWPTEHSSLGNGVPQPQFLRHGEADLAEAVYELLREGCSWRTIFRLMDRQDLLLRDKQGRCTQNTWQTLHKWAKANYLPELVEMESRGRNEMGQKRS